MLDSGIPIRHIRLPNRADIRHMFYTRHQLCRLELCASWEISGKRKKKPTTELNIFLRKKFSTKNSNVTSVSTTDTASFSMQFKFFYISVTSTKALRHTSTKLLTMTSTLQQTCIRPEILPHLRLQRISK